MKTLLSLALVFASMVLVHAEWTTDYKAALATAKSEKKLVLLNFTGSDWCPACKLLDKEVFPSKTFKDYADKRYVLVTLDFPEGKDLPPALKKQNDAIHDQYNVDGFPTLLVVDANGKELGRQLGYKPSTGPEGVIAKLKSFDK